ncbi:hypothetical protein VCRA2119O147_1850005 [Vibrio crassostreae]|nr:hypothetical protein VCRA2114E123_110069 [Vibrio crassostreae]CAK1717904.1 hypothetical protein VCRA2114E122_110069 [Vibrio crassostreae]CAK1718515.1 hypothetical protein VCRA2113O119_110068 [Vibrio crassostreae]CAK1846029.1 hypothetical protein VCRA2114E5_10026 [Vibrio crassostreae]CAK1862605.1 hypothetical protein VCRA2116O26_10240 [Vibrio crassostreae]
MAVTNKSQMMTDKALGKRLLGVWVLLSSGKNGSLRALLDSDFGENK